jgi:hypothetical protein
MRAFSQTPIEAQFGPYYTLGSLDIAKEITNRLSSIAAQFFLLENSRNVTCSMKHTHYQNGMFFYSVKDDMVFEPSDWPEPHALVAC